MKLHRGRGPDVRASCADWIGTRATATPADLDGEDDGLRRERHTTVITGPRASSAADRFAAARAELLACRFFPDWFATIVVCGEGQLVVGATVLQRLQIGPVLSIDAPVRVVELVDQPQRVAITLVTVHGHPERGVERYDLRIVGDRTSLTVVKAWELADWFLRLGFPAALVVQRFATRLSLHRFRDARWQRR